jgi:hypothetical protein
MEGSPTGYSEKSTAIIQFNKLKIIINILSRMECRRSIRSLKLQLFTWYLVLHDRAWAIMRFTIAAFMVPWHHYNNAFITLKSVVIAPLFGFGFHAYLMQRRTMRTFYQHTFSAFHTCRILALILCIALIRILLPFYIRIQSGSGYSWWT